MIKRFYQYAYINREFFKKGYVMPTQAFYESEKHFREAQKINDFIPVIQTSIYIDFPIPNDHDLEQIEKFYKSREENNKLEKQDRKKRLDILEQKVKELNGI